MHTGCSTVGTKSLVLKKKEEQTSSYKRTLRQSPKERDTGCWGIIRVVLKYRGRPIFYSWWRGPCGRNVTFSKKKICMHFIYEQTILTKMQKWMLWSWEKGIFPAWAVILKGDITFFEGEKQHEQIHEDMGFYLYKCCQCINLQFLWCPGFTTQFFGRHNTLEMSKDWYFNT